MLTHNYSNIENNFNYFKLYLKHLIEGKYAYNENVKEVIKETQDYYSNKISVYDISNENYDLVIFFKENFGNEFLKFDINKLDSVAFKKILEYTEQFSDIRHYA